VEEICDRVVFLHLGRVVAEGTPLEISRRVLASDGLDAASLREVFLKIAREGAA
jgi:ABC-2 type transport system ATP-binding protein